MLTAFSWAVIASTNLWPLLFGIYWRRTSPRATLASMIAGVAAALLWQAWPRIGLPPLPPALAGVHGFVVGASVGLVVIVVGTLTGQARSQAMCGEGLGGHALGLLHAGLHCYNHRPPAWESWYMPDRSSSIALCFLCVMQVFPVFGPRALAADIDPIERAIVASVNARQAQALELLENAVNINSGTLNVEGVREVGELFQGEFDALGFSTRWIGGAAFERAGHLVATHGSSGPHFLLIGHLDTVFEPNSSFQTFDRISETHASGPGTTDMKGGDVIILEILHALREAGVLGLMQITVFLTGDEERSGRPLELARGELVEAAQAADYALGFEDGDGDPRTAVIARRGSSGWTLKVEGKPAHSSQVFSEAEGYGAIYEMARILDRFRTELSGEQFLTFNPGMVVGGSEILEESANSSGSAYGKANVIAAAAVVTGDLRTLTPEQLERTREGMRAIVAESLPGSSAEIEFRDGYPPLAPTEGNRELLALYSQVSQDLGYGTVVAVDPARAGAADISFASGLVDGALCGLGLMGVGGHTEEETADLRTLGSQTQRAALLIWRLARP